MVKQGWRYGKTEKGLCHFIFDTAPFLLFLADLDVLELSSLLKTYGMSVTLLEAELIQVSTLIS